jgi:hypothetical protein
VPQDVDHEQPVLGGHVACAEQRVGSSVAEDVRYAEPVSEDREPLFGRLFAFDVFRGYTEGFGLEVLREIGVGEIARHRKRPIHVELVIRMRRRVSAGKRETGSLPGRQDVQEQAGARGRRVLSTGRRGEADPADEGRQTGNERASHL